MSSFVMQYATVPSAAPTTTSARDGTRTGTVIIV